MYDKSAEVSLTVFDDDDGMTTELGSSKISLRELIVENIAEAYMFLHLIYQAKIVGKISIVTSWHPHVEPDVPNELIELVPKFVEPVPASVPKQLVGSPQKVLTRMMLSHDRGNAHHIIGAKFFVHNN